jgi:hypothetical protein
MCNAILPGGAVTIGDRQDMNFFYRGIATTAITIVYEAILNAVKSTFIWWR